MQIQLYIKVRDVEKAQDFYVSELGLFKHLSTTTSVGDVILRSLNNPSFDIYLELGTPYSTDILFGIEVEDCSKELKKIKEIDFKSGGSIYKGSQEQEPSVFEYPLGKSFMLIDPFGNRFVIYEDY